MSGILLGAIADDFTGATDLANNLVRCGMRVVQTIGVPGGPLGEDVDAVVVALKSRTIAVQEAVAQSLAGLAWLRREGVRQVYFKYCSTFDSTPEGNIGPVTEALMDALGTDFTIACPAFPENRRTVFKGYLFAGEGLLNESGMQNHPLTPMTDANLVRVMQAQCRRKVGLIDYMAVAKGESAITARVAALRKEGVGIAVVDAISDDDLRRLGPALRDFPLVTAGSGVAIGLPANWGLAPTPRAAQLPPATGHRAIVSGSCSVATRGQVEVFKAAGGQARALDAAALASDASVAAQALDWAAGALGRGPVLVYSTAEPEAVKAVQQRFGIERAGSLVEHALATIARGLVERGVRQLVVAGGETSGAVVQALGVERLRIGPQIDPGVPWCAAHSPVANATVHLALKSGNFGAPDFFAKSFATLAGTPA
ncbi:MAG TPA: 3-oxo-tetronate kinase [Usitatibacteraceae bacterium]|nr:3-oxo-tetronate kinase [Usitatibacteraceae bacterium]